MSSQLATTQTDFDSQGIDQGAGTHGASGEGRLVGVDLARGVAVFGMFAAHVGPDPAAGGVVGFVMELAHGRSSALFAFLAGFTIVLITGRPVPKSGRSGRQAVVKVVIRALILMGLGTGITLAGTPVQVILAFYGVYFLLVLPCWRLTWRWLALAALTTTLVLPQVCYAIAHLIESPSGPDTTITIGTHHAEGILELLVTGNYPALCWVPFVLAGMAVARLDLTRTAVRIRLAAIGFALACCGYGGSWLALHTWPGAAQALRSAGMTYVSAAWWSDTAGYAVQQTPAWLLVAQPHSETTLSILGNTGVAIVVVTACLAVVDASQRLRWLAGPVIAVGSMSLTGYIAHVVGIRLLGITELPGSPLRVLLGFIAVISAFAVGWSHFFRRGPVEWLLNKATGPARHIR